MKKKTLLTAMSMIMVSACICGSFSATTTTDVYARSEPLVEEREPENAVKGKITISAIFKEGHNHPVKVELCPKFDGGVTHSYVLSPEESLVSDEVAIGGYHTIAYLAEEDENYINTGIRILAQTTDVSVTESNEGGIPSTVVIMGDKEFIDKYGFELAEYRKDDGEPLSGYLSVADADGIHRESIEDQTGYSDILEEDYDPNDIEYEDPEDENTQIEETPEEIPEGEEAVKENKNGFTAYLKFIIPAVAVVIAAAYVVIRKKRRG